MKKLNQTLILAMTGILTIFLFCGVECKQSKDDPAPVDLCGEADYKLRIWDRYNTPFDPADYYLETIDGRLYYQFSVYVPESCHKKHAKVWCYIIKKEYCDVGMTPRADYSFFYQIPGEFIKDGNSNWEAEIDFGMQHAFPDNEAAFFWGLVIISCPEQATTEEDLAYFRENITNIQIRCDFHKYKPPPG